MMTPNTIVKHVTSLQRRLHHAGESLNSYIQGESRTKPLVWQTPEEFRFNLFKELKLPDAGTMFMLTEGNEPAIKDVDEKVARAEKICTAYEKIYEKRNG